jgi:hypothetical protein
MKCLGLAFLLLVVSAPAWAGDGGVSISVGEPGFFGRIDIGDAPPPLLVRPQPVTVVRAREGVVEEPVYLHVPPGHEKHWRQHCGEYDACGRRVYFVQDRWYNEVYVPHYRERHRDDRREARYERKEEHEHEHGEGHHDKDRGDRHDDD